MGYRVYLVEDELKLNNLLTLYLRKEGWEVVSFSDGEAARAYLEHSPDIWVLDIMLPGIDGYELLREIKARSPEVPIIFISARDESIDRIVGLELGSDDYLSKPFLPRELVIRVKRVIERKNQGANRNKTIELGNEYRLDKGKRLAFWGDENILLTSKEFDLLLVFAKNPNKAFAREEILDKVWGNDYFGSDRVVDDLVRRLRKKMPELNIETIYGFGYRWVGK